MAPKKNAYRRACRSPSMAKGSTSGCLATIPFKFLQARGQPCGILPHGCPRACKNLNMSAMRLTHTLKSERHRHEFSSPRGQRRACRSPSMAKGSTSGCLATIPFKFLQARGQPCGILPHGCPRARKNLNMSAMRLTHTLKSERHRHEFSSPRGQRRACRSPSMAKGSTSGCLATIPFKFLQARGQPCGILPHGCPRACKNLNMSAMRLTHTLKSERHRHEFSSPRGQ